MNYKSIFILIILLFVSMSAHTQNVEFTLHDLIPGGKTYDKYQPQMPKKLQWYGDKLLYIKGDSVINFPLHKDEKSIVFITKQDINTILKSLNKPPINRLNEVSFPITDQPLILIRTTDSVVLYNFEKNNYDEIEIPNNAQNIDFSSVNNAVAYTIEHKLNIRTEDKNLLTLEDRINNSIISLGQAVHRNEFGINKGTFWGPKGRLLAFYKMDETMVTNYPLVNVSTRIASLKNIKYPMAGMKSHEVTVGIIDTKTKETVYLKTEKPKDKYLTNITWSPDEKSIYIAELNRKQDTCRLNRYNVETGDLEATVFEETHSKYVEPERPILFLKNDSEKFIWLSKRDGYNHAYLYNTKGELIKQLTTGNWDITSICGFDNKGNIIYISTEESPIEQHIYRLNIETQERIKLSKEQGVHKACINNTGKYIYDFYTSQYNPGKIAVTDISQNKTTIIHEAQNPFTNKMLPEIILGKIIANDGKTDLYFRLTKPLDFDPSQKYPTIIYVYGGPHSQMVSNSWMGAVRGWDIYMAQKGYIIFTLDNRGTANRGFEFENITHHQLGIIETQDQMKGYEYLKSLPYVDIKRIGVHGWSFGGFMTLNLMLRHPEVFKVGVAGGPVTDWKYYEVMYGERYMGTPAKNIEGYNETSMLNKAKNLQGRLMLIHGDEDPVVVMQHSLQFLKESIKAGTHPDFFIYPGHKHNMDGTDRIHLHEHITRYFDDHLK